MCRLNFDGGDEAPAHSARMAKQSATLFTVGYQGASAASLIARLQRKGVRMLLDVRERPRSRRPEFNQARLEAALAAHGIAYLHDARLGSPARMRRKFYADGDFPELARSYRAYVRRWCLPRVRRLAWLTRRGPVALLCYEADAAACHRGILADEARALRPSLEVLHL